MGRKTSLARTAAGALCGACGQGKGACAVACAGQRGRQVDSFARANAALGGACVAAKGPADEVQDRFPTVPAAAETAEVQSLDPGGGIQRRVSGLVVQWGALGRTGVLHEE